MVNGKIKKKHNKMIKSIKIFISLTGINRIPCREFLIHVLTFVFYFDSTFL